ncbi:phosphate ABC transporter permease PstA [Alphaproteobacteria bacterium HT1-32]|nr:phosphate ABC transporter permease PstA [Alphaproteobacteria bacterium HT1-32]
MTDIPSTVIPVYRPTADESNRNVRKRYNANRRLQFFGLAAIGIALLALATLLTSIIGNGWSAFQQTNIALEITFDRSKLDPRGDLSQDSLRAGDYRALARDALRAEFPDVKSRTDRRNLNALLSPGAHYELQDMVLDDPSLIGQTLTVWLPVDDEIDMLQKGYFEIDGDRFSEQLGGWIQKLSDAGKLEKKFNTRFFSTGDSREPELAGVWGAAVGSFLTLIVTLAVAFPVGVLAAVYLEEFAPKNKFTDLVEVNINNLAAVPSIVFGLLGLAVFIQVAHLPRSAPVVGGLTLALMTLPTLIIASRAALKAVPPSIREAALGLGASPVQAMFHHTLPLAMPGILTGTIIGMAQALGETAPLLMIGMVAFIVDIPSTPLDAATVLPVQIYLWADSPERAFVEKTSAAIMVLLGFLVLMNGVAVLLRKRFERRW